MNESLFVIAEVLPGKLNALVKNIMLQMGINDPNEAVRRINSGEWVVSQSACRWREQDGVIYFTLPPTDGTTGPQWIERLEKKGLRIEDYAKSILCSPDFKPTSGIKNEIAVLKGMLFSDDDRITKKIRAEADRRKLTKPNAEVACLIREMFTDEELEAMDLWRIVAMHEPINDSDGGPDLLYAYRSDDRPRLYAYYDRPGRRWRRDDGFAFVVSQVSTQV